MDKAVYSFLWADGQYFKCVPMTGHDPSPGPCSTKERHWAGISARGM